MMNRLALPVWNGRERRLRMFWRLALLLTLWFNVQRVIPYLPFASRFFVVTISLVVMLGFTALLIDRRSLRDYGIRFDRHTLPDLGFGLLWGAILVSLIAALESLLGWLFLEAHLWTRFYDGDIARALLSTTLFYVGVSLNEEMVFRGCLLTNFAEGFSFLGKPPLRATVATVASALLFGWIHFDNPFATVLSGTNLVLYGFLLAVPFLLTGSLAITIGLHFTWNVFLGIVYGLPVSGYPPVVALMRTVQSGPELWTGGNFGPEGGLLTTLFLLVELGGFLLWIRVTRGRLALAEGFGDYRPVRVFSITPREIRQERKTLYDD